MVALSVHNILSSFDLAQMVSSFLLPQMLIPLSGGTSTSKGTKHKAPMINVLDAHMEKYQ